ncbi:MAG: hypothetical protein PHE29_14630 [Tissierellia bacterium]|nr:hypothetical protein [Tissierellia bacterium]
MISKKTPEKEIIYLINQSNDIGKKDNICFKDIIDIILLYISLQEDICEITIIETIDFYYLVKREWFLWTWHNTCFKCLNSAWDCKHKAADEDQEPYIFKHTAINRYDMLRRFYYHPKRFNREWDEYKKKHIIGEIFPKWKNSEKIKLILELAKKIHKKMQKM